MSRTPSEVVAGSLQRALADLIDISLQGKQAHWNIYGSHFRSLHLQLDEIVTDVRLSYDDVAERLVALGGAPDGRADTIAATSKVEKIDGGPLAVDKVIQQFDERLSAAAERIKADLPQLEEDLLTQDLLVAVATSLEKHAWMLRASR